MKQYALIIVFLFSVFSTQVFSQTTNPDLLNNSDGTVTLKNEPKFYLTLHGGGSVALGSTFKFYPDDITAISVTVINNTPGVKKISYKAPSKGLGDGFRFGAGLSYIINDFINVGIDVDYFNSTISKVKDSSYSEINTSGFTDYAYNERYTISYDASLLTITPNITFKAISHPRFFIYNKIGAIITIRPNSIQRERQQVKAQRGGQGLPDSIALTQKRYDWGIRNPAYGFMGGIGAQFKVTQRLRAYAEVQFSHVLFQVRSRSLTDFTVNGNEILNTLPVSERKIEFKKDLTTSDVNVDPNMPSEAIVQRFPVTYVGFQVGVAYRF